MHLKHLFICLIHIIKLFGRQITFTIIISLFKCFLNQLLEAHFFQTISAVKFLLKTN